MTQQLTQDKFRITPTGISITGTPSLQETMEFAEGLFQFIGMAPIAIADIYVYVRDRFGEAEAAAMVPSIGRTKHTINNWVSIVRQFPAERRVEGLEMGHYDAVTKVKKVDGSPDVGTQDSLLRQAADQRMPIARLRTLAEGHVKPKGGKTIEVPDAPQTDGDGPVFDAGAVAEGMQAESGTNIVPLTPVDGKAQEDWKHDPFDVLKAAWEDAPLGARRAFFLWAMQDLGPLVSHGELERGRAAAGLGDESQAKAGDDVDRGTEDIRTSETDSESPDETEPVSRAGAGRAASATSEKTDATARRDGQPISPPRAPDPEDGMEIPVFLRRPASKPVVESSDA